MSTQYTRKSKLPFQKVVDLLTESLAEQGFAMISTHKVNDMIKKSLDVEFRNYQILTACDPTLAYKALSLEAHVGLMLPCNIVVQEHENGEIEVSAINPLEKMDENMETYPLTQVAAELSARLCKSIDAIQTKKAPVLDWEYA